MDRGRCCVDHSGVRDLLDRTGRMRWPRTPLALPWDASALHRCVADRGPLAMSMLSVSARVRWPDLLVKN